MDTAKRPRTHDAGLRNGEVMNPTLFTLEAGLAPIPFGWRCQQTDSDNFFTYMEEKLKGCG